MERRHIGFVFRKDDGLRKFWKSAAERATHRAGFRVHSAQAFSTGMCPASVGMQILERLCQVFSVCEFAIPPSSAFRSMLSLRLRKKQWGIWHCMLRSTHWQVVRVPGFETHQCVRKIGLTVHNPLTKVSRALPPLFTGRARNRLFSVPLMPRSSSFLEVFVATEGGSSMFMHVYDSATNSWVEAGVFQYRRHLQYRTVFTFSSLTREEYLGYLLGRSSSEPVLLDDKLLFIYGGRLYYYDTSVKRFGVVGEPLHDYFFSFVDEGDYNDFSFIQLCLLLCKGRLLTVGMSTPDTLGVWEFEYKEDLTAGSWIEVAKLPESVVMPFADYEAVLAFATEEFVYVICGKSAFLSLELSTKEWRFNDPIPDSIFVRVLKQPVCFLPSLSTAHTGDFPTQYPRSPECICDNGWGCDSDDSE